MTAKKPSKDGEAKFTLRLKVWIENPRGEVVLGMGRVAMLEAIQKAGSLNQAAHDMNMSYRALWGKMVETESRLGQKLLVRNQGGEKGGGSRLTPLALELVRQFEQFQKRLQDDAREIFQDSGLKSLRMETE